MNFSDAISSVLDKMRKAGGVEVAFGNPQTVNDLTVITVAKVAYGFGGGGGKSTKANLRKQAKAEKPLEDDKPVTGEVPEPDIPVAEAPDEAENPTQSTQAPEDDFGGGGGGGMKTQPLGIFVIHNNHVRFLPVLTVKEVSIAVGLLMLTLYRIFRKKR